MNITKDQFTAIQKAIGLIDTSALSDTDIRIYSECIDTIEDLKEKQAHDNRRTWEYIKKRRETDKDYARPVREHHRH